jgi:hypothetical protein
VVATREHLLQISYLEVLHKAVSTKQNACSTWQRHDAQIPRSLLEAIRTLSIAHVYEPHRLFDRQGTAVLAGGISALPAATKERIRGVVLFGYTRNLQNGGKIPNFPANKVKVFCQAIDTVCYGTLMMTPGHFSYKSDGDTQRATQWMVQRVYP